MQRWRDRAEQERRLADRLREMNAQRRERSRLLREAAAAKRQGLTARVQQMLRMAGGIHVVPDRVAAPPLGTA